MSIQKLKQYRTTYMAAGLQSHPTFVLIASALATGSEDVCSAVADHVAATTPSDVQALALISREIDSSALAPTLWTEIDLLQFDYERLAKQAGGKQNLKHDERDMPAEAKLSDHVVGAWRFRKEAATHGPEARPISARILLPANAGWDGARIEALGRHLPRFFPPPTPAQAEVARAALLRVAIETASQKGK